MAERNETHELNTFKAFAKASGLPIRLDTIIKKNPPKPDIQCDVIGIGFLAFELVRIMDQKFANLCKKNKKTITELHTYLSDLSNVKKEIFNKLYSNALISINFLNACTFRQRKRIFPEIIDHLLTLDEQFKGTTFVDGKNLDLKDIRITRNRVANLRFRIDHADFFSDPIITALKSKFGKKYKTKYPIHLLAYIDITPMIPENIWLPSAEKLIQTSLQNSQFKKVWIFDIINGENKMIYP